jgi:hypothetical protein
LRSSLPSTSSRVVLISSFSGFFMRREPRGPRLVPPGSLHVVRHSANWRRLVVKLRVAF